MSMMRILLLAAVPLFAVNCKPNAETSLKDDNGYSSSNRRPLKTLAEVACDYVGGTLSGNYNQESCACGAGPNRYVANRKELIDDFFNFQRKCDNASLSAGDRKKGAELSKEFEQLCLSVDGARYEADDYQTTDVFGKAIVGS